MKRDFVYPTVAGLRWQNANVTEKEARAVLKRLRGGQLRPTEYDRRLVFDTQPGEAWGRDPHSIKWYKIQPPPLDEPKK